jgi:hypothetical protein
MEKPRSESESSASRNLDKLLEELAIDLLPPSDLTPILIEMEKAEVEISSAPPAPPILTACLDALSDFRYPFHVSDGGGLVEFSIFTAAKTSPHPPQKWLCRFLIDETHCVLRYFILLNQHPVSPSLHAKMGILCGMLCERLCLGSIEWSYNDERAFFRNGLDLRSREATALEIVNLLQTSVYAIGLFETAYQLIKFSKAKGGIESVVESAYVISGIHNEQNENAVPGALRVL